MPGILKPIVIVKENIKLTASLREKLFESLDSLEGCNLPVLCTLEDSQDLHKKRYLDMLTKPLQETDLVIGAKVMDLAEPQMMSAMNRCIESILNPSLQVTSFKSSKTIRDAVLQDDQLNLAVIDLDEDNALREAHIALKSGLNVMIQPGLSKVQETLSLKELAKDSGLLFIGSGAGASVINGASLGPFNRFNSGKLSIVATSSVALQELTVLADRLGVGIRQALCVGALDLSPEHKGLALKNIINLLAQDPDTENIVIALPKCSNELTLDLFSFAQAQETHCFLSSKNGSELNDSIKASTVDMMIQFCNQKGLSPSVLYPRAFPKLDLKEQQHLMKGYFLSEYNRLEAQSIIGDQYAFVSYADLLSLNYELESFSLIVEKWLSDIKDAVNSPETASIIVDLIVFEGIDSSYINRFFDTIQQGAYSDFITVICSVFASSCDQLTYQSLIKRCRDTGIVVAASNERASSMAKHVWSEAKIGVIHAVME